MRKLYFILGTIVVGVVALMVTAQVRKAIRIAAEKEPNFGSIQSPALTGVLTNADAFWKYVTAPETPYDLRMAAVVQAENILPMQDWPRLVNAQYDLQKELELHGWALTNNKVNPWDASWLLTEFSRKGLIRTRNILGHIWTVPDKGSLYPTTHQARCDAPWPWQVQQALKNYRFPAFNVNDPSWIAKILELPCDTDAEASLFVALSNGSHSMRVLARWRKIAIDTNKPEAAREIAAYLDTVVRRNWDEPIAIRVGQVIFTDMIKLKQGQPAKGRLICPLFDFRQECHAPDYNVVERPIPVTSVLALCEEALDPANGNEFDRLESYVYVVCRTLNGEKKGEQNGRWDYLMHVGDEWNQPPLDFMELLHSIRPNSPKVHEYIEKFQTWFKRNESKLREEAAKEAPEIERLRNEMISYEP